MSGKPPLSAADRSANPAATAAHLAIHSKKLSTKNDRTNGHIPIPNGTHSSQFELASASAAASLAHAYHTEPDTHQPQSLPETNGTNGLSSRAAYLASRDHSTATSDRRETTDHTAGDRYPEDDPGAQRAASSAIAGGRKRAESDPHTLNDLLPDLAPAMSAAAASQKVATEGRPVTTVERQHLDGARLHGIAAANVQREMHTSRTPGEVEADEKRRAAVVSMAQQMYAVMPSERQIVGKQTPGKGAGHRRRRSEPSAGAQRHASLHEIAQRRVTAQLAKLEMEQESASPAIRPFRRASAPPLPGASRRRRWSSSEVSAAETVRSRAKRKPFQSTAVGKGIPEMDEALMVVAKRNAETTIEKIDKQIYHSSGRPTPAMMLEWEKRAHQSTNTGGNSGTANSGIGRREKEIEGQKHAEDLARQRLKPIIKEIHDRADEARGRGVANRLDKEHEMRYVQREKQRQLEVARAHKRLQRMLKKRAKKYKEAKGRIASRTSGKAGKKAAEADEKERKAKEQVVLENGSRDPTQMPSRKHSVATAEDCVTGGGQTGKYHPESKSPHPAARPSREGMESSTPHMTLAKQREPEPQPPVAEHPPTASPKRSKTTKLKRALFGRRLTAESNTTGKNAIEPTGGAAEASAADNTSAAGGSVARREGSGIGERGTRATSVDLTDQKFKQQDGAHPPATGSGLSGKRTESPEFERSGKPPPDAPGPEQARPETNEKAAVGSSKPHVSRFSFLSRGRKAPGTQGSFRVQRPERSPSMDQSSPTKDQPLLPLSGAKRDTSSLSRFREEFE